MTRDLLIDPAVVRRPGRLDLRPIPLNAYQADVADEVARRGERALRGVLRDMILIRTFEAALDRIKRAGSYEGVEYLHRGPAHLSIGQEAAAVGQALELRPADHIFGSHRSHGEVLAKGLSAIAALPEEQLREVMEDFGRGRVVAALEENLPDTDTPTRATQFLLYGLLAEIFGRATGFNQGLGGSMHAFFPPFGIYPNNAIVGGSAPIAVGAALAAKRFGRPGLVVANIGDASAGCGPVWEALNLSAMEQFSRLWEPPYRGGLPVVFFFVNNFYGMGGQPMGETMAYDRLSRIGLGVRPDNLHAESIDGNDPLAVADAMRRARERLEAGEGPVLIDCQTYRQSGHSPSDASSYRTPEETELWRQIDPIDRYAARCEEAGLLGPDDREAWQGWARDRVAEALRLAVDPRISPRLDPPAERIEALMFSDEQIDLDAAPPGQVSRPLEETPRFRMLQGRSRSGLDESGETLPGSQAIQFRDALFEAIAHHAVADDRLVIYGEENRDWGGAFAVYRGLTELLPYHRLFNTPISEAAIVGSAVGYAMEGGRALVELMYADFIGRAGDEIFNQLAKWQAMSGGLLRLPVVLRVSVGETYGAQHSQDWSAMVAHVPGLKVVYSATPYDAKGLMAAALSGNDPVVFFESQRLYGQVEVLRPEGVPPGYYRVPIGLPHVVRTGGDLTVLSVGPALYRALEAAHRLQEDHGLETEVIDARSLVPFDYRPVLDSVRRTGRLLLVSDACLRGSFLATLASHLQLAAFGDLQAPIALVGARNTIAPPAELVEAFLPTTADILDAVHLHLRPLPGHRPAHHQRADQLVARAARGV
ncbi:MAG: thiamine pyrophosphate-dependent enzyme [Actinomycetota bacterium]|nr:thiamine pyrophosphate-dependent enzyme [Actinomycetota bacterium]